MRLLAAIFIALCILSTVHADDPVVEAAAAEPAESAASSSLSTDSSERVTVDNSKLDLIIDNENNILASIKAQSNAQAAFNPEAIAATITPSLSSAMKQQTNELASQLTDAIQQAFANQQPAAPAAPAASAGDDQASAEIKQSLEQILSKESDQAAKLSSLLTEIKKEGNNDEEIISRLDRFEKELSELKNSVSSIMTQLQQQQATKSASSSGAAGAAMDANAIATMIENQRLILAKLDEGCCKFLEQYFHAVKAYAIFYGNELLKLGNTYFQKVREQYPGFADKVKEQWAFLQANGFTMCKQYSTIAYAFCSEKFHEYNAQLTSILVNNKIPPQYAPMLSISIIAMADLLILFIVYKIICSICGCICCRRGSKNKKKKGKPSN